MNRLSIPNRIALTGAVLCLVMGIFVLAGWWFDIPAFRSLVEETGYMKPNSAIAFALLGAALWISVPGPIEGRRCYGVWFCIGLAGCIGGDDLCGIFPRSRSGNR